MGFTRSTTDISVHQGLSDYPNQDDGLSAEQLKERFDFPAETLQDDLNNLEDELEAVTGAANIGADVIATGDESDANVQAKLNKLYEDIQNVSQGAVPDGSITQEKLASTLVNSLAFKNGNIQTGLNAEKVGGNTLEQIFAYINGGIVTGTYTGNTTNSTTTKDVTIGFQPKLLVINGYWKNKNNAIAIIVGTMGLVFCVGTSVASGYSPYTTDVSITMIENGFRLTGSDLNYSGKTYTYVAFR